MKKRTLYVSDMDGTLLNSNSEVSARQSEIISELSHAGALITVATARTPATVVPLMSNTFISIPYIVLTGAAMYDHATESYHNANYIPADDLRLLLKLYADAGIHPFVYHHNGGKLLVSHHYGMTSLERDFYTPRSNLRLKRFVFEATPSNGDDNVMLLFSIAHHRFIEPLAEAIRGVGRFSVSCYPDIFNPEIAMLEVYVKGVSKANAIKRLMTSTGAERLVVFGDNLNDLPMLDIADVAVAVDNAHEQVKERADIIIGCNNDDAVAQFIRQDFNASS